ncbi:hypothetical protein GCM10022261_25240 [Brevibacterium daeguense]|uniref:Tetratricopeptide repeat protein n=1 Tax=Brevibacterium daeguense TaxID=909936 RepID=A0ABP8EM32_9MICO|nr:hypothetical protein [Brevibacterium daeguense]
MSKAKIGALVIAVLLAVYLVFTLQRGWIMITDESPVAKFLGIALIALPVIGAWALISELLFGTRMQRLGGMLEAEGGLPEDNLPRTPGGRVDRTAADAEFARYRAETEAAPEDWRSWFRLSCAYDVAGDRRRARQTMRRAISLERTGR